MQEDSLTYHLYSNDTIREEELYFDKYFLKKYSSETPFFPEDSAIITIPQPKCKYEILSRRPETFDCFFGVFLIAFIIFGHVIGKNIKISFSTLLDLFAVKTRKGIFSEPTNNEWYGRLFLCFQTCLLIAVFLCKYFEENSGLLLDFPIKSLLFLLLFTIVLCIFFVVKFGMYYLVGAIFFSKEAFRIWTNNYFSLIAFLGIFLFFPVLFYFYGVFENFCFYLILFSFISFEFFLIYKSMLLFFYKLSLLLHLFLYLCAQEIIPLFFLWEIVVKMFNFVARNALWL